jgi:hypothetical protein
LCPSRKKTGLQLGRATGIANYFINAGGQILGTKGFADEVTDLSDV